MNATDTTQFPSRKGRTDLKRTVLPLCLLVYVAIPLAIAHGRS
jgi:hypothetical protein